MDFLYALAFDLLLKLLLDRPAIQKPGSPPSPIVHKLEVEAQKPLKIPQWVSHTPEHGFVGISGFCQTIEEARRQATRSAIVQIVQTMGAEYSLSHESRLEGNAHYARHELKEKLVYTAQWFVRAVNENVREMDIQDVKGKYLCFLLVRFPPEKIEKLRRLTIGSRAGARIVQWFGERALVEVWENNGVEISLAEFEMELIKRNHHARVITMFLWKIPEKDIRKIKGVLDKKIVIKNGKARFSLSCPPPNQNIKSLLYGSERQLRIVLYGYDEIGRVLSLPVSSF